MALEVITIPCLSDNYAFLARDEATGEVALFDVPEALEDRLVNLAENEADLALRLTAAPPVSAHGRRVANSPLCLYAAPSYLAARPDEDMWVGLDYRPARDMAGGSEPTIQANGLLAM